MYIGNITYALMGNFTYNDATLLFM